MVTKKSSLKKTFYKRYKGPSLAVFNKNPLLKEIQKNISIFSQNPPFFDLNNPSKIKMLGNLEKSFKITCENEKIEDQLINKVTLMGNLGQDPEIINKNDIKIVKFSLATSQRWNDKTTGQKKEITHWHRIVIMNDKLGEIAEKYLRKGSKVYVEGQLQNQKWVDKQGAERSITEVLVPKFKGELVLISGTEGKEYQNHSSSSPTPQYSYNEDVPF